MTIVVNNQNFGTLPSGSIINMQPAFKTSMDTVLISLGRDITLHLPPVKLECVSSDCKYNSTYKRYIGTNGKICETCRGQGFLVEPRQTVYRANIRWTNEPYNESGKSIEEEFVAGRLAANFARTKTVVESFNHLDQCIGATIDGRNVEVFQQPRQTAFGNVIYIVTWWKEMNR
jgi:hypothetical protein